jgi:hypothetical protein
MVKCNVCNGEFKESPDSIVMCSHKGGPVHLGCCVNNCSGNKQPCMHSQGLYDKVA